VALEAIQELVNLRLIPDVGAAMDPGGAAQDRLEKATVTYVAFATIPPAHASENTTSKLQEFLDDIANENTLSTKAVHAAQTLLWKTAGAATPDSAEQWWKLLKHPIFDGAGQMNKAKIGRKAILASLDRGDVDGAREAFFEMPQAAQNDVATRYLAFRIALQSDDHELAADSLRIVSKWADKDATFLYACVLQAQQSNRGHVTVAAMNELIDRQPPGTDLRSLLRCTANLLFRELNNPENLANEAVADVVQLFERAVLVVKTLRQGKDDQCRAEIQWWSKNAYNQALRLCADIHPEHLIRLLKVCTRFLDYYPSDGGPMHQEHITRRRAMCHFLSASALIVLARASDENQEYGLQAYLRARQEIAGFMDTTAHLSQSETEGDAKDKDLLARKFELLKFDLECALHLKQWDQIDGALQRLLGFRGSDRWDTLADLLIVTHEEVAASGKGQGATSRIQELLQRCINETWKKDKDITRMARWMRIAFKIHLQDDCSSPFALKLVQQAAAIARKGSEDKGLDKYPYDELEWLATSAFNVAVDRLTTGEVETAEKWIEAALELATWDDEGNGALHANLTRKKQLADARMAAIASEA
jgi:hypothetical protein